MPEDENLFCYNHPGMILVSGGTGFIGSVLVRKLSELGFPVRLLIHPSKKSPQIPKGIPVEIGVSSLSDERGLRAVLKDVDVIYHLASSESKGARSNLHDVEIQGTINLCNAAKDAGVKRLIYLSHLGADRASAYPLLKAKGIAENAIMDGELNYTIIRSGIVYGINDRFTTNLARLINRAPVFMYLPTDGNSLVQPVWVEDVATSLVWCQDNPDLVNRVISIGGPEYIRFKDILVIIMFHLGKKRRLVPIKAPLLSRLTEILESFSKNFPTSVFWIDYLAEDRICDLNSISNYFGFIPARFETHIGYLKNFRKE